MAQSIREVMTENPTAVTTDTSVIEAAKAFKDGDFGALIVTDGEQVAGILTDRDIVVRVVAEERDPADTTVGEIATKDVKTLSPDDSVEDAIELVRQEDVRRVPVVEGAKPVGIVSIGDLAVERDQDSALADLSSASPNN
jgi:CBS domain-containing protein